MKPDILVVEPDATTFDLAERRLRDRFHLVWAPSAEAADTAFNRFVFDAVLVKADHDESLALIRTLTKRHPGVPVVAIAQWEVQGDRASACGARDWVSAPVNYHRLAAVLDYVMAHEHREPVESPNRHLSFTPA